MSIRVAFKLLTSQSGAASWTSPVMMTAYDRTLSLTITWLTDANGTLALLYSDAPSGPFIEVPGSSAEFTQPTGANAQTDACNWSDLPGRYWQLSYTRIGGSGAFTVTGTQGDIIQR